MDSTDFANSSPVSWAEKILPFFQRKSNSPTSKNGLRNFNVQKYLFDLERFICVRVLYHLKCFFKLNILT